MLILCEKMRPQSVHTILAMERRLNNLFDCPFKRVKIVNKFSYYMASSASGQDDPNRAL